MDPRRAGSGRLRRPRSRRPWPRHRPRRIHVPGTGGRRRWITAAISFRSAWCSTRCSPDGAFSGESAVETLNAILKDTPPDVSEQSGGTRIAPALDKIIARCLEKKPERRFQSASDLGFALEALTEGSGPQQAVAPHTATDSSGASSRRGLRKKWRIGAAVAALAIAAGLGWMALPRRPAPVDPLTMRMTMTGPENARDLLAPMVSPDGRYVAFGAVMPDSLVPAIWLRALDSMTVSRLPGTDGAVGSVIWSPDSRSFVFPGRESGWRTRRTPCS